MTVKGLVFFTERGKRSRLTVSMGLILAILGALLVLEGIPYLAFPARVKEWAAMMQEVPEKTLRVIGLVSMVAGLSVLFSARVMGWLG